MSFITRLATCPTALQSRPFSGKENAKAQSQSSAVEKGKTHTVSGVSPRHSRPSPFAAVIVCHAIQYSHTVRVLCCRTRASFLLLAQPWCEKRGPVKTPAGLFVCHWCCLSTAYSASSCRSASLPSFTFSSSILGPTPSQ